MSAPAKSSAANADTPQPAKAGGFMRLVRAFGYSLEGLGSCLKNEAAFRQEVIASAILGPFALLLPIDLTARLALVGALFFVLIVELLNSAVEWTVDLASTERHPFGKRAKDMGSAAVLLSLVLCAIVWVAVFHAHWATIVAWVS